MSANDFYIIDMYLYKNRIMSKKLTTEEFINKAINIHGDKYNYSNVEYVNNSTKIKIICSEHGEFEQKPNSHLSGYGCLKCGFYRKVKKQTMVTSDFIFKSNQLHNNKYDYSLVDYQNSKTKVKILCSTHGIFTLKPNCHLTGSGCPRCVGRGKTTNDFINEAIIVHGKKFDYSNVEYKSTHEKIDIICIKHGVFKQSPNQHLNGGMCPKCNESKGENIIRLFLEDNNIKFINQYKFKDCRNIRPLPFDFYLPEHNICIEFQGEQHFKVINWWGGKNRFIEQQKKDKIKKQYCIDNDIELVEIHYNEKITDKLKTLLYVK